MESLKNKSRPLNPRAKASPLSALTFGWTLPIFWRGLKKEFEEDHLFEPLEEHASGPLGDKFAQLWEEEVARAGTTRKPSLLRVIMKAYAARCMLYGIVLLVMECGIRLVQPLFLGMLVEYYASGHRAVSARAACLCAAGVVLCSALNVFVVHPYMMAILHMGMKFRVACCSLIYRKSLRLSKTALGETTVGQVVNLLSNDVNRFDVAIIFLHYLWIGPLATVVITYLMWQEISWAALVGVAFMLAFIPLQAYLGKRTSVLRLRTALRTDERVRLMSEILAGIQVIKMYTWEKPFADLVATARKQEIKEIRSTSYIRGALTSFVMFTTRICLFGSILAFVMRHDAISAKQVFVVTSFYNILRQTMTVFFPQGIAQVAEATISIKRLESFMLYEDTKKLVPGLAEIQTSTKLNKSDKKDRSNKEVKSNEKESNQILKDDSKYSILNGEANKLVEANGNGKSKRAPLESGEEDELDSPATGARGAGGGAGADDARLVRLDHVSAKWLSSQPEFTIADISLTIKPGSLVGVVGAVGAGKSSLLNVLLGELPLCAGSLHLPGVVSYASQEPWLFSGTVRQNILFGQPLDRMRYNAVVRRCALDRDFALLPRSDKTRVGERGFSLSGGQRARISLARAVYRRADVYLLDDPLSAVDARVARHLFESCVRGYLRPATRFLVTHQLQFLKDVDQIVILKNGCVAAVGDFESLSASGLDLAALVTRAEPEEERDPLASAPAAAAHDADDAHGSFRKRQMSIHSVSSLDNVSGAAPPEGESEGRAAGSVAGRVYAAYLRASGHPLLVSLMLAITVLAQLFGSGSDWWTSYWVNLEERPVAFDLDAVDANDTRRFMHDVNYSGATLSRYDCIYIYSGMVAGLVVVSLARSMMFFWMATRASRRLHDAMFAAVTCAPMRFFHANPSGRVLNRFSKDMGAVDEVLPFALLDVLQIGLSLLGIVVVVAVVNYWLLLPTLLIGLVFYALRGFYLASSRAIKRLEGVTRSPVFSHLNASLQGITTIRAFGAQEALIKEFDAHQDLHSSAWYLFIASSRAFGFWLDLVCVIYIAIVTASFLAFDDGENGGNVGLAITQAMGLTGMFQWGMRQSTELENQMTSVERILEYTNIEPEPGLLRSSRAPAPTGWPRAGRVEFREVWLYYAAGAPAVLRGLRFVVLPAEKVGIVGRTGAGKSSLINALFRLALIEGAILIDGVDTSQLALQELRSRISIIPQEPVLFSGTLRHNLDPFDEYPDHVLWQTLQEVELKEAVSELPLGLNSRMSEGGGNLSVGQRQLVCLARAMLRQNRLLVLDEATANVDPQTDALIQRTLREKFAHCTVLTIAHRLHTVMDSDKVLVMEAGQAVEMDHPHVLLERGGALRALVEQTGANAAANLAAIAREAYARKQERSQLDSETHQSS